MKKTILFCIISISFTFSQDYEVLLGIENLNEEAGIFSIRMANSEPVGGFQISFTAGLSITSAAGGTAADAGFLVSAFSGTALGFSLTGTTIPAGDGVLLDIEYTGSLPSFNFTQGSGTTISDGPGGSLLAEEYVVGLNGIWCAESDFDLCGICYFNDDAHFLYSPDYTYIKDSACTGCMESDAENYNDCSFYINSSGVTTEVATDCTIECLDCCAAASDVLGCMDSGACNYNADATVSGDDPATPDIDESCWSANEGCTCDDSEGSEIDCAGECDGSAIEDCTGVCGGSSAVDECGVCGGSGLDDCGECPGLGGLYGYTGIQDDLGGFNSTCTGCMDIAASNYNSTVGDPIQSSNLCSGDGCTLPCSDADGDGELDCCYYAIDSSAIAVTWDLTVVKDATTTDDEGFSVPAVYMEIKDLTEGIDVVYRNWWFSANDSLYLTENLSVVSHFFTGVNYGDSTDIKLQIITSEGHIFEKSERVELKAPYVLSNNNSIPTKVWLSDNYPNPFNPTTSIEYSVQKPGNVSIAIYNIRGDKVFDLVSGYHSPGIRYSATWNSNTETDIPAPTGIYLYEMRSGNYIERKKMLLVK